MTFEHARNLRGDARVRRLDDWLTRLRALAVGSIIVGMLAACGGGGGGGGGGSNPTGSVQVTVVDEFDGPVLNASVSASVGGTTRSGSTSNSGVANITSVPTGTATIAVTATGFEDGSGQATIAENQQASVSIELVRITEPGAGAAQFGQGSADATGQELTFTIDVVVVNDDPNMPGTIDTLTAADFTLQDCTVDPNDSDVECLRGQAQQDIGYTVPVQTPSTFELIPANVASPYAAMLLLDQSGSISESDPSDARLFATKVFLDNLGANDYAAVSAFAQTGTNAPAGIPEEPVTRLSEFIQSGGAAALFDDIDELAQQEGGLTPIYDALDQEMQFTAANAPAGPRKAVVLFTDGECPSSLGAAACSDARVLQSIDLSQSLGVDIFTVGLGPDIDVDVLRDLATGGNGVFLFAENAQQLFPIYRSLGQLLSRALATYRMEFTIRAAQDGTYLGNQTVLGTLTIDTGENVIDLPIRIFLPTP